MTAVAAALAEVRSRGMVLVLAADGRHGQLVTAAEHAPADAIEAADLLGEGSRALLVRVPVAAESLHAIRAQGFPTITTADLADHRDRELARVRRHGAARVPLPPGSFRAIGFVDGLGREHVAFVHGDPESAPAPLVRLHGECLLGDVLGSALCDCRANLRGALDRIARAGCGVLVYVRAQREAIRTALNAGAQRHSLTALDRYVAAAILTDLGLRTIRLAVTGTEPDPEGVRIVDRVPLPGGAWTWPDDAMGSAS
ncbi:hypothetical protein ACWDSJ_11455 [Nocardia sp. NPDC003482]